MAIEYVGKTGTKYYVSDNPIASGGEGVVSNIDNYPSYVAKVFKDDRRTFDREQKLNAMIQHKLNEEQCKQLTWPVDVLYDQKGFAGYVMPLLKNGNNLNELMAKSFNEINYKHRVLVAYNICAVVDTIHEMNQVCGDLNPQNIYVNMDMTSKEALNVTFVDTDSYHINATSMIYRCEVGLANYIAPEIQKKMAQGYNLKTAPLPTYTKETDLFALAVHIFTLLMNGAHPFACAKDNGNGYEDTIGQMNGASHESAVMPQPIDNIKNGFFPFIEKIDGITIPVYSLKFNALPQKIRELFIKTFSDGYKEPSKRSTAKEWMDVIREYLINSEFAGCMNRHIYFSESSSCPFCEMAERQKLLFAQINKRNVSVQSTEQSNKNVNVVNAGIQVQQVNTTSSNNQQYNYSGLSNIAGQYTNENEKSKPSIWFIVLIIVVVCIIGGLMFSEIIPKETKSSYGQSYETSESGYDTGLE